MFFENTNQTAAMGMMTHFFTPKVWIFLLGILLVLNAIIFYFPNNLGSIPSITDAFPELQIQDMSNNYSFKDSKTFLVEIGPSGRNAYQRLHLTTDFVFPFVYGLFFFEIIQYFLEKLSFRKK